MQIFTLNSRILDFWITSPFFYFLSDAIQKQLYKKFSKSHQHATTQLEGPVQ